ncbi:F-type H+-transporting ATPase subunit delta [Microbacterium sp. SORGH_AS 969]|nr:F-type H+-transporting ATPase subunit delta [Microbacterium sp. SORGH_AS_0969]
MGSATTQARTATAEALASTSGVDLDVARELFAAVGTVSGSAQLSGALSDSSVPAPARAGLVSAVFGSSYRPATVALLSSAAQQRWSTSAEFVEGIEELAVRATAVAESADIEPELFSFSRTVAANGELELALGGRLGDASAKGALVTKLLDGRVSAGTTLIVSSLVQNARGRRVRALLRRAESIVADQRTRIVATVLRGSASERRAADPSAERSQRSLRFGGHAEHRDRPDGGRRSARADRGRRHRRERVRTSR